MPNSQYNLSGGLFTKYGRWLVPENHATLLQNADVSKGGFRKLPGSAKLNSVKIGDNPVPTLKRLYAGSLYQLIATSGANIYYWTGSTFSSLKSGLTANKPWSTVVYDALAYMTNGYDTPQKWNLADGSTVNMTGPADKCRVFFCLNERTFACNNDDHPDRLYYSKPGLPENWGTGDEEQYIHIPLKGTDERALGMGVVLGKLTVLTENSITLMIGTKFEVPDEWGKETIEQRVGCIAYRTIKMLGGYIFFLGRDGVYVFDGVRAHRISEAIQPVIDDINRTYITDAVAETDEQRYYLSYTSTSGAGTVHDKTIIFDTTIGGVVKDVVRGGWVGPHKIGAASICFWQGVVDKGEIFFGDATATGFAHEFMDVSYKDFSGGDIDMVVETEDIDHPKLGGLKNKKHYKWLVIIAEPEGDYNLVVKYYLNNKSTPVTLGTINLATIGALYGDASADSGSRNLIIYPLKFPPNIVGHCIRLRFEQSGTGFVGVVRGFDLLADKAGKDLV